MKVNRSDLEVFDAGSPDRVDRENKLAQWSQAQAEQAARELGIQLTDAHWSVIESLRDYYIENGLPESARQLSEMLAKKFAAQGGLKYLYRLFPKGPVAQGMRIAGLPLPAYTEDTGFGSAV
jgi:TusE/DsrC/DsvC family sulfur relay protein